MLTGGLADLTAALDTVLTESLSALSAAELTTRACELERLASKLEAARCATLAAAAGAADAPATLRELGYRNPAQAVADRAKVDPRVARRMLRLGTWVMDFPIFAAAFAAGDLTHRHLDELRKLDSSERRLALVEAQEYLVEAAATCDFEDFLRTVVYWLNAADPDGQEPREQTARTGCSYRKHADGSVSGRFFLDPLAGQAFRRAVDSESQRLFRQDAEDGRVRSPWQRGGEALVSLVANGAKAGAGAAGPVTPLVNIVVGLELAENLADQLTGAEVTPMAPSLDDVDRRCELDDGTPLHPRLAAVALASGMLRRIVLDAAGRPLDASVKARGFPPWMKEILLIQARGRCRSPGCDAPLAWLQADHVRPHSRGGPTALSNGQILCDPHNKWKRDREAG